MNFKREELVRLCDPVVVVARTVDKALRSCGTYCSSRAVPRREQFRRHWPVPKPSTALRTKQEYKEVKVEEEEKVVVVKVLVRKQRPRPL